MVVASVMGRRRRNKEVGEKRKKAAQRSKSGKDLVGKFEMDPEAKLFMTGIMHKYDMDHDAELNFGELKALMIDMNEGCEVLDHEVKTVMRGADESKNFHISREELESALQGWFEMTEEKKSSCCPVS